MFELLNNIVEEIGEENVVQIVTEGASNLVAARKSLIEKRTKLFWSIVQHIVLIFHNAIDNAKKIPTHIYLHPMSHKDFTFVYKGLSTERSHDLTCKLRI